MANLVSIEELKRQWNNFIKSNNQQLITGVVLNSQGHNIIDTFNAFIQQLESAKLNSTDIGFDPELGINLPAGLGFYQNGVNVLSQIVNGGGPAGPFDASGNVVPTTGTGNSGAIVNGNFWRITVAGTIAGLLPEEDLLPGDILVASKNNAALPGDFYMIRGDQEVAQILTRLSIAETKLATIENGATADQTAAEIITLLQAVINQNEKLDQSAVKNIADAPYNNQAYPNLDSIAKALSAALYYSNVINPTGFTGNLKDTGITNLQQLANWIDQATFSSNAGIGEMAIGDNFIIQ